MGGWMGGGGEKEGFFKTETGNPGILKHEERDFCGRVAQAPPNTSDWQRVLVSPTPPWRQTDDHLSNLQEMWSPHPLCCPPDASGQRAPEVLPFHRLTGDHRCRNSRAFQQEAWGCPICSIKNSARCHVRPMKYRSSLHELGTCPPIIFQEQHFGSGVSVGFVFKTRYHKNWYFQLSVNILEQGRKGSAHPKAQPEEQIIQNHFRWNKLRSS